MKLALAILLTAVSLFAQPDTPFNAVAQWIGPENTGFSAITPAPIFAPTLIIWVRPSDPTVAHQFVTEVTTSAGKQTFTIDWRPSSDPDWQSTATTFSVGTTITDVAVTLYVNAGTKKATVVK